MRSSFFSYRKETKINQETSKAFDIFSDENANAVIMQSKFILELIDSENAIILAPGRSPYFHSLALKHLGVESINFAFSGHAYSHYLESTPSRAQLNSYREYLTKLGITPDKLYNLKKKIIILDVIVSGGSIKSLLYLLSHWQYEQSTGTELSAEAWCKNGESSLEYQYLADHAMAFRLPNCIFVEKKYPCRIVNLDFLVDRSNTISFLAQNRFPVLIPQYFVRDWNSNKLAEFRKENSAYILEATRTIDLMHEKLIDNKKGCVL